MSVKSPKNVSQRDRREKTQALADVMVARGLATARAQAEKQLMAGLVFCGTRRLTKAGERVPPNIEITVRASSRFVGRGGEKLAGLLKNISLPMQGCVGLDVGSATGGFADCLLQAGAQKIFCVDVGRGLLHPRLRTDPRVVCLEGTHILKLMPAALSPRPTLAVIDVSFISLKQILPHVLNLLAPDLNVTVILLIKPQFEAKAPEVPRGGVIRDEKIHQRVIEEIRGLARSLGLKEVACLPSALRGAKGNQEFFWVGERVTPLTLRGKF